MPRCRSRRRSSRPRDRHRRTVAEFRMPHARRRHGGRHARRMDEASGRRASRAATSSRSSTRRRARSKSKCSKTASSIRRRPAGREGAGRHRARHDPRNGPAVTTAVRPRRAAQPWPPPPSHRRLPATAPAPGRARVSPMARKLAADLGVDLARVTGTGSQGAITREDVDAPRLH